jgi:hypothetical protein
MGDDRELRAADLAAPVGLLARVAAGVVYTAKSSLRA